MMFKGNYPTDKVSENSSEMEKEKKKGLLGTVLKDFASEFLDVTSIGGLGNAFHSRPLLLKLLWLIVLVVGTYFTCNDVYNLYLNYISYPYTTQVNVVNEVSLQFPGVTVCNQNPISCEKLLRVSLDKYGESSYKFNRYFQIYLLTLCGLEGMGCKIASSIYYEYQSKGIPPQALNQDHCLYCNNLYESYQLACNDLQIASSYQTDDEFLVYLRSIWLQQNCLQQYPQTAANNTYCANINKGNPNYQSGALRSQPTVNLIRNKRGLVGGLLETLLGGSDSSSASASVSTTKTSTSSAPIPSASTAITTSDFVTSDTTTKISSTATVASLLGGVINAVPTTQTSILATPAISDLTIISGVVQSVSNITASITNTTTNLTNSVSNIVSNLTGSIINATTDLTGSIINATTNLTGIITNATTYLTGSIINATANITGEVANTLLNATANTVVGVVSYVGGVLVTPPLIVLPTFQPELDVWSDSAFASTAATYNGRSASKSFNLKVQYLLEYLNLTDEERIMLGYTLQEFIVDCSFMGLQCNMKSDFVLSTSPTYGNCYTFSRGNQTSLTGSLYGLSMVLSIQQETYLPQLLTPKAGARLAVHSVATMPPIDESGIDLPVDMYSSVGIKLNHFERLPLPFDTACYNVWNDSDYALPNPESSFIYSASECLQMCLQQQFIRGCVCRHPLYPDDFYYKLSRYVNFPVCNLTVGSKDYRCIENTLTTFANDSKGARCGCNVECKEDQYQHSVTQANWAPIVSKARVAAKYNATNLSGDLLSTNIYFNSLVVEQVILNPVYQSPTDILAALGGSLGLYLGFCLVAIGEIIEFILMVLWYVFLWSIGKLINPEEGDEGGKKRSRGQSKSEMDDVFIDRVTGNFGAMTPSNKVGTTKKIFGNDY